MSKPQGRIIREPDSEDDSIFEPKRKHRGPGRPKGSKNRPKDSIITAEKLKQLYNRFEPYLTDDQKVYIQGVIDGRQDVDCFYEMKLLVRQMSLLFQEAATWFFAEGKINQDLGKFADSLRMALKDLYDMQRNEEDKLKQQQDTDDLVRITERGSTVERLEELLQERSA